MEARKRELGRLKQAIPARVGMQVRKALAYPGIDASLACLAMHCKRCAPTINLVTG